MVYKVPEGTGRAQEHGSNAMRIDAHGQTVPVVQGSAATQGNPLPVALPGQGAAVPVQMPAKVTTPAPVPPQQAPAPQPAAPPPPAPAPQPAATPQPQPIPVGSATKWTGPLSKASADAQPAPVPVPRPAPAAAAPMSAGLADLIQAEEQQAPSAQVYEPLTREVSIGTMGMRVRVPVYDMVVTSAALVMVLPESANTPDIEQGTPVVVVDGGTEIRGRMTSLSYVFQGARHITIKVDQG